MMNIARMDSSRDMKGFASFSLGASIIVISLKSYPSPIDSQIQVIELAGKLDQQSADHLVDTIDSHLEGGKINLVFNCAGLNHVTSIGLGSFVQAQSRSKKLGGEVKLACVNGVIADILRMVRFDRLFLMYESVDEACSDFSSDSTIAARSE